MATLFDRFSSRENLKKAYEYVKYELAHSSLSVNPINHPSLTAIDALGEQFFIALEQDLRDGKYTPERGFFVYIPKDNLGLRPVAVLSMIDRIVYQAMFNQDILGNKIDGQLLDGVCFANRVNEKEEQLNFLMEYSPGWDEFCKTQKAAFDKGYTWKSEVDVQQYYEHIPIARLVNKLRDEFGIKDERLLSILKSQLCTWAECPELPKGIPQGPDPSAVLSNAYLSALDTYAEKELAGKNLKYFRYADDIVLMGKTKEQVLKATEKMVHFLREHNLNLNEKTRLRELEDNSEIEAMRFISGYEDDTQEIPEDDFTRIKEKVPHIIETLNNGGSVEKQDIRELKYYLKVGESNDSSFLERLVWVISKRPSLTISIIQFAADGREAIRLFGNPKETFWVDCALWDMYKSEEISEWSKFWILKLLASSKDMDPLIDRPLRREIRRILASKDKTIFKIVALYYRAIHGQPIDIAQVKQSIKESTSDVEKSLYSFFLLNAFEGMRASAIKDCIEKTLNATSQEMNLIGSYLFQNKAQIKIEEIEGEFSSYLLQRKPQKQASRATETRGPIEAEYVMVRTDALIPVDSPSTILGVKRKRKLRHTVELSFPEIVRWEKVTLKMKSGLKEVEILYDGKLVDTVDHTELGFFSGNKEKKPDRSWGFLCALAVLATTDTTQATPTNLMKMIASNTQVVLKKQNVYQIKKTLVNRLRAIFKTDEDPFYVSKEYYQPKFTISPEPDLRREEVWRQGGTLPDESRLRDETEE
jgi:hypothetical protein